MPGTRVALLTQTTKMPGPSWSIPAHKSCHRALGSICDNCYAGHGCYLYTTTRNAQAVRFAWTVESMRTLAGRRQWTDRMRYAIERTGAEWFRVHDSGDMFSVVYAECWLEICRETPRVGYWIPTRVWQSGSQNWVLPVLDPLMGIMRMLAQLPNVTVRPSALNFGDYAPVVPGLHAGSTAEQPDVMRVRQCIAPEQDGECGGCRVCWTEKSVPVAYARH